MIGKGITVTLPYSLDTWGMMCEGDLAEVYDIMQFRHKLYFRMALLIGLFIPSAYYATLTFMPFLTRLQEIGIITTVSLAMILGMTKNELSNFLMHTPLYVRSCKVLSKVTAILPNGQS